MKIAVALAVSCAMLALVRTEDKINIKQVKLPEDMVNADGSLPDVPDMDDLKVQPDQMERRGGKGESSPPPSPGWGWGPPPMPMMHGGWAQPQPIIIPLTIPISSYGRSQGSSYGNYGMQMPYGR